MAEKGKYDFGRYEGNDLKALVKVCTSRVQNESFERTKALMELSLGIVCKLLADGFSLTFQEIVRIWNRVN